MARIPHLLVDAFVGPACRGNRAAVILLDAPVEDESMQEIAMELGEPATAFLLLDAHEGAHDVRWFSAKGEIGLCGHGSLAAGHVVLSKSDKDRLQMRTRDGRMIEMRQVSVGEYELALPAIATAPREWPELAAILGAAPAEIRWNENGYALAIFETPQDIAALAPDIAAIAAMGSMQLTVSAAGGLPGVDADITSRVFSRAGEDAATGSAHSVLTTYWAPKLGKSALAAHQASPPGGWFQCRLDGDRVWLGGQCSDVPG